MLLLADVDEYSFANAGETLPRWDRLQCSHDECTCCGLIVSGSGSIIMPFLHAYAIFMLHFKNKYTSFREFFLIITCLTNKHLFRLCESWFDDFQLHFPYILIFENRQPGFDFRSSESQIFFGLYLTVSNLRFFKHIKLFSCNWLVTGNWLYRLLIHLILAK